MPQQPLIVINCTTPVTHQDSLAKQLVDAKLIACANVVPSIHSIYEWQGTVEQAEEALLILKTRKSLFDEVAEAIRAHHPYDVPEIIAQDITHASADYADWIIANTKEPIA